MNVVAGQNKRGGSHNLVNCTLNIYGVKINSSATITPRVIVMKEIKRALAHIEPMLSYYTYALLMANS
tara:strand:- start:618 stop:821 length:204 start_codon:yes stop_codon:yes gene_type:complete